MYQLSPQYDSRKSFYGKAWVRYEGDKQILRSYSTDVAYIQNGEAVINGTYSQTTLRHIKDFLYQNGFEVGSSEKLCEMYMPGYLEGKKKARKEARERKKQERRLF